MARSIALPVQSSCTGGEPELLASCYSRSLELASQKGLASLAFPCISTGIYSYPVGLAARVAVASVQQVTGRSSTVQEVIFCCFSPADLAANEELLREPVI